MINYTNKPIQYLWAKDVEKIGRGEYLMTGRMGMKFKYKYTSVYGQNIAYTFYRRYKMNKHAMGNSMVIFDKYEYFKDVFVAKNRRWYAAIKSILKSHAQDLVVKLSRDKDSVIREIRGSIMNFDLEFNKRVKPILFHKNRAIKIYDKAIKTLNKEPQVSRSYCYQNLHFVLVCFNNIADDEYKSFKIRMYGKVKA